jgi:dihydropyrimidine dehydrogenase (NAD+) subunit PreT
MLDTVPISEQRRAPSRIAPALTLIALVLLGSFLLWRGYDYYRQDLAARAAHPDYRLLNPAGLIGHGYGIVGTALIAANLLYLVRRRLAGVLPVWIGSMKGWLNAHVFTGLVGSLLIVFHSAFQLRTPIATVTSASLGIVVATGLIGLYLHALVPKAAALPLRLRLDEMGALLPGLSARVAGFVKATPATRLPHDASFLRALITIPAWIRDLRIRRRGLAEAAQSDALFRALTRAEPALARAFVLELSELATAEVDALAGGALMRSWRSLHRFLALLMLSSVSLHIGVAWYYGFRWIFER